MARKRTSKGIDNLIYETAGNTGASEKKIRNTESKKQLRMLTVHEKEAGIKRQFNATKSQDEFDTIRLDNLLTVDHSQKLREKLLEALKIDDIRLTSEMNESVDLTAIQLFYSLYKSIRKENGKISIHIKLSEEQQNLLQHTGIYDKIFAGNKNK